MVGALLRTYHHLEERINETNGLVKELYEKTPSARLIQTVPGFGIFLAVLVAVEIEDLGRFEDVSKSAKVAELYDRTLADLKTACSAGP